MSEAGVQPSVSVERPDYYLIRSLATDRIMAVYGRHEGERARRLLVEGITEIVPVMRVR